MKKLNKKWIILAAALVVVIAAGVVTFCIYNSTENVAIRSVTNVFESALEREEFQVLSEFMTNGSIEVEGTVSNIVGSEPAGFGGKIYFNTETQATLFENINFNGISGSAYLGRDKVYVSGNIVNDGIYGIIAGEALTAFRESPLYTAATDEITTTLEVLLESYDDSNYAELSEDSAELYNDLIEIFYECLLNNVELESETKEVKTGGERISARVITVEINEEVLMKTCGDFLEIILDNQDVKDFIEKYESRFVSGYTTSVLGTADADDLDVLEMYEDAIEAAIDAIDAYADQANDDEGIVIEIVTSGVTADLYKLTVSDLDSDDEIFVLDVGEEGIAGSQRIEITVGEEFSILYEIKQNDDEALKASLEIDDEEIFSIEIDREDGKWEFEIPASMLVLKGNYEEDGDVTTIELTKMSIFGEDFSEYFTLKLTINTDDPMPVASDDEITNIFTMTKEELTEAFAGILGGAADDPLEIPDNDYFYPEEGYNQDYYY